MKTKILTFGTFLIIIALFSLNCKKKEPVQSENALKWHNFNEGINIAKKNNKLVLIDFYASWCQWCIVMEKEIFSNPEMIEKINKNFICVKLYMDSPSTGIINYKGNQLSNQQFSMLMGVKGLPTLIFLNNNEDIITLIPGYVQKPLFSQILDYLQEYINKKCIEKNVSFNVFVDDKSKCN